MPEMPKATRPHYFRTFIGAVSLKLGTDPEGNPVELDFRTFIGAVSLKHRYLPAGALTDLYFRTFIGAVSLKLE